MIYVIVILYFDLFFQKRCQNQKNFQEDMLMLLLEDFIRKVCMTESKPPMHTCRPQGATLRKVLFLPFCPSFSWLGKTDSGANKVSAGVCEAYVEIPEISKNRYFLHYKNRVDITNYWRCNYILL